MLYRVLRPPAGFIEPCLPSVAIKPPKGPGWIHEIKHDGYRLMAQRHGVGARLLWRPRQSHHLYQGLALANSVSAAIDA